MPADGSPFAPFRHRLFAWLWAANVVSAFGVFIHLSVTMSRAPWGARLKEWRAVATRYEKTARSFPGVLHLAAVCDRIRS